PRSTQQGTLFPYTTLFRSRVRAAARAVSLQPAGRWVGLGRAERRGNSVGRAGRDGGGPDCAVGGGGCIPPPYVWMVSALAQGLSGVQVTTSPIVVVDRFRASHSVDGTGITSGTLPSVAAGGIVDS